MKIDVISGFLGAGKTTFIKRLLQTSVGNEKVVLIENEFGEVSVDSDFLKESKIDIQELSQGCICCSLVGDFSKSLNELIEKYNPDRILIEPSGVGKLSDVEKAIADANLAEYLNSLICLVDVTKAKMYTKNFGEFFLNQIEFANTIILSRTDVAKPEKVEEAISIIRKHNDSCVLVTTPIKDLSDDALLSAYEGINEDFKSELLASMKHEHHHEEECCCGHHHEHEHHHEEECNCGHHHHHHADEIFTAVGIETAKKFDIDALNQMLVNMSMGEYGMIVRAKGIICGIDGLWYQFNLTPVEVEIDDASACHIGKICVIGSNIDEHHIKELF